MGGRSLILTHYEAWHLEKTLCLVGIIRVEESKPDFVKLVVKIPVQSGKAYTVESYQLILRQSVVVEGFYN